jgi:hypothetical protein
MVKLMEAGRRPKSDGSAGSIISYDPGQNSFKQAIISTVFTGMWLEAFTHLVFVNKFGKETVGTYDRKSYEEKLKILGCTDSELLKRVTKFRQIRTALVHEKAHLDGGEIKTAQDEAENAHEILFAIHKFFARQTG